MFDKDSDDLKELMKQVEQLADPMAMMILRIMDRGLQLLIGEIGDRISLNLARCMRRTVDDLVNQNFTREEAVAIMTDMKSNLMKSLGGAKPQAKA